MDKNNLLVVVVMLLLLLVAGWFVLAQYVFDSELADETTEPYQTTLTGERVCLGPRNPALPISRECRPGILTDDGVYYSLDLMQLSGESRELALGTKFSATGLVTPLTRLSTDQWQNYNLEGIFSVTDLPLVEFVPEASDPEPEEVIATTTPTDIATGTVPIVTTTPTITKQCYVGGCSSQLCTDNPDVVSDCMYREEYACYQGATCEVQGSGECGWTETPELLSCLSSTNI